MTPPAELSREPHADPWPPTERTVPLWRLLFARPVASAGAPGLSLYRYILETSGRQQLAIVALTVFVAPLTMAPLELQRRMVDHAVAGSGQLPYLFLLGAIYLAVLVVQGGAKYLLNLAKGRIAEHVTRDLRRRTLHRDAAAPTEERLDPGTKASLLASETEAVGGFASDSLATPMLQAGTILWVVGYLVWVQPQIAALAVIVYLPQLILVPLIQKRVNRLARMKTARVRRLTSVAVKAEAGPPSLGWRRALALIDNVFDIRLSIYRNKYIITALGNFLDALGPLLVLIVGGAMVIAGHADVATLVVFITGFQKIADPWDVLVNFFRTVSNSRVSYLLVADALMVPGRTPPTHRIPVESRLWMKR